MEILGFAAVALVFVAGAVVATRLLGRSDRNRGSEHGGGYSSSVESSPD